MSVERSEPRGFTLVEVLIVVAIIGVMAAIAIPSFLRYQLRAKVGEALVNIRALATAEETFFTEHGHYVSTATPAPPALPSGARLLWVGNPDFDELGWAPEGASYFQYLTSADEQGLGRFTIESAGDVDGDGVPSFFGYVKPAGPGGLDGRLAGSTCEGIGVFDPASGTKSLYRSPGPCDAVSGRDAF
jgi:type IV pilus assembly protein PilA